MNPDRPHPVQADDRFERNHFATVLARTLVLPKDASSLVIGLEGEWGSGKTTLLDRIKHVLAAEKPDTILIDFNPWLIASLDSVLEGFLVQMAASLGTCNKADNARATAKKVLAFAKLLSPIKFVPGAEPWVSLAQRALEGVEAIGGAVEAGSDFGAMDINAKKTDVQKAIDSMNRPIIVFIDDVDRLPPNEVRTVFQLVKAVANYNRVSYLLAYDPTPVKDALSYDRVYDGSKYLEKIVQLSFPMPRWSYGHRRGYLEDQLTAVLSGVGMSLSPDNRAHLDHYLNDTGFLHALRTPRDVVRLMNKYRMSLLSLGDEVNIIDLLAYWLIEIRYPAIIADIAQNTNHYIELYGMDPELDRRNMMDLVVEQLDEKSGKTKSKLSQLLERLVSEPGERKTVSTILKVLFPKLGGDHGRQEEVDLTRICHRNGIIKVLHHMAPSFTMAYADIQRFAGHPDERADILRQLIDDGEVGSFLIHYRQAPADMETSEPFNFCQTLVDLLGGTERDSLTPDIARLAGHVIHEVWMRIADQDLRNQTVHYVISCKTAIAIAETALLYLLRHYGVWSNMKYYPDESVARPNAYSSPGPFSYPEVYAAKDTWLQTVREVASTADILETEVSPLSLLMRWGELSGNNNREPAAYVQSRCHDPEWLRKFITLFDLEAGAPLITNFIENPGRVVETIERHLADDERAKKVAQILRDVNTKTNSPNNE